VTTAPESWGLGPPLGSTAQPDPAPARGAGGRSDRAGASMVSLNGVDLHVQ
jgi:hypothetical protein